MLTYVNRQGLLTEEDCVDSTLYTPEEEQIKENGIHFDS